MFSAVTGDGCRNTDSYGYEPHGVYTDGASGWYRVSSGGWNQHGCAGSFYALPQSGSKDSDDPTAYVIWWFDVGSDKGMCTLSVYIPTSTNPLDVGGRTAFYTVIDSKNDHDVQDVATVNQTRLRGTWVEVGRYDTATDHTLALKLHSRGEDPAGEHLAAAQARVTCSRS